LRILLRLAGWGGLVAMVAGLSLTASAASDVVGHVYVNDNTAGTNTIAAFDRHSDGSLTPTPGSPFDAGGSGTGTVVGSQGALQLSGDGRYLLAVDAGSNQVSVLRILLDGALRAVGGGPVWSGGFEPVSIAAHGGLVYVANEGDKTTGTGSNYTGFRINAGGHLVPIEGSTFDLPATANPGDILFNSTGTNLIGVEVGTNVASTFRIDSFVVGSDGVITPAAGSPFPAQAAGPFGSEFSPANPAHLYVSNAHGGAGNGSVSAFNVTPGGTVSSIGRALPPHRQHRQHHGLQLRDLGRRLVEPLQRHGVQDRPGHSAVRRPAGPGGQVAVRRRRSDRLHQRLRSFGWQLDRARPVSVRASGRRDSVRDRRQLANDKNARRL
jgi:hypothetical protein